ncbi:hypothetical protein GQ42DRAFT_162289 [Ramicandelaber brevisporus]|nr:hypothetical protein GQ42DRAFT_162289 [Ramicandelaber brevisporus]
MPPKRRRTLTKPSTALDSLRDKIHSFADTADEEQLREVAQLIDRLSISNHGPFRLLDLPYELLESTAERYFTREEAASVLPVNLMFNELFANRVWKSVEFDNMNVNGRNVPMDVLMKNARRIRAVDLGSIEPDFFVSAYFPFATSIAFEVEDGTKKMFTLHLEQMKHLRRVALTIDLPTSVINAAAKWINDSHRSGHVQQIVIKVAYSSGRHQSNYILSSLMNKIKFKKRIRLECESLQLLPANIIRCMPVTLTQLFIAQGTPKSCHCEINKQVFDTDPGSVFVHLRTLSVQVCCSNSSFYDFQSFVPERFPVLSCLVLGVPRQSCNGDVGAPLATIFSNKQWPSVTDLEIVGNDTVIPGVGQLLFKAMPALQCCIFRDMAGIDVSSGLDRPLTISRLSLINTALEADCLRGKLTCLVYLELEDILVDSNHLNLIASCKRLVEIKLIDCNIMRDALVSLSSYPCNSVRKVVILKGNKDTFTDRIAHLLPAFPNLHALDLTDVPEDKQISFVLKCPTVKIIT